MQNPIFNDFLKRERFFLNNPVLQIYLQFILHKVRNHTSQLAKPQIYQQWWVSYQKLNKNMFAQMLSKNHANVGEQVFNKQTYISQDVVQMTLSTKVE